MLVTPLTYFRRFKADYALGILCLVLTNAMAASIPWQIKGIIDRISHGATQINISSLLTIVAVIGLMFCVRVLSRYLLIGVGRKIEFDVRMTLYRHLLTLPRSYFDRQQTGELMSRLTNDLTALRMFLGGGIMLMANVVIAYCTILPLMFLLSWRLTLLIFLVYPVVIITMRFLSARIKGLSHRVQDRLGDLTAIAQENFSGMGVIQSYAKEPEESARFYDASEAYFKANMALNRARVLLYLLIAVLSGFSILMILGEGGREVIIGVMGISGLTAFMLYLERLAWPTISMGWILSSSQQGLVAIERINRVLQVPPETGDARADRSITQLPAGDIIIKNLWFRYETETAVEATDESQLAGNDRDWVLRNISLTLPRARLIAIVGPIGAGKTTLLNLLTRIYPVPEGTISIGETPLEAIPMAVLRRDMTLMPQSSFLFSTSVESNVAYSNPELPFERIADSAQTARIHDEILGLPQAYATMVGERGITLSGGQRQRAALARTLLVAPQVLLLDDPFSNVDGHTEAAIIDALRERQFLQNRTTIFTSQRFTLVRQADCIVVLNAAGELDAVGTHDDLLSRSALYRSLSRSENPETVGVES